MTHFRLKPEVVLQKWLTPHSTRNTRLYQVWSRSQTRRVSTSGFIGEKPVENRKLTKMAVSMLKRKVIVDFLVNILITIWFRPQLPVLSPKNRSKPEVEQNGRKYAQTKSKSWLVYELIKNHMLPTSASGFIAWNRDPDNPLVTLLPRLQREADGILVNLLPRAKREAEGILLNQ